MSQSVGFDHDERVYSIHRRHAMEEEGGGGGRDVCSDVKVLIYCFGVCLSVSGAENIF